ncbi:MAG: 5-(carboxyamino)imidazole ribonucleotide synthase [Acidobacteriota bacterium]
MNPILPGATVGVLGSGQLGRMLALSARAMGYRIHTLSPQSDTPTGQVADREVVAAYDDLEAVREFARRVDVVTFEFENVAADATAVAAEEGPVRPAGEILHITQNRRREKAFLARHGFPLPPYREVTSAAELDTALAEIGTPAVLKTAGFGYDGKGQVKLAAGDDPEAAWRGLATDEAVLEAFVDFVGELSVVVARAVDGSIVDYGPVANDHVRHILDLSLAPAPVPPPVASEARAIAHGVAEQLDLVGVLCVELFRTSDDRLLVNELAPRPHNSGHWTIEGCTTSQFEQQLRAACGLALGEVHIPRPVAMVNLLGDLWQHGEPNWDVLLAEPGVKLQLYGKAEARVGRKMGHLTVVDDEAARAKERAIAARELLRRSP